MPNLHSSATASTSTNDLDSLAMTTTMHVLAIDEVPDVTTITSTIWITLPTTVHQTGTFPTTVPTQTLSDGIQLTGITAHTTIIISTLTHQSTSVSTSFLSLSSPSSSTILSATITTSPSSSIFPSTTSQMGSTTSSTITIATSSSATARTTNYEGRYILLAIIVPIVAIIIAATIWIVCAIWKHQEIRQGRQSRRNRRNGIRDAVGDGDRRRFGHRRGGRDADAVEMGRVGNPDEKSGGEGSIFGSGGETTKKSKRGKVKRAAGRLGRKILGEESVEEIKGRGEFVPIVFNAPVATPAPAHRHESHPGFRRFDEAPPSTKLPTPSSSREAETKPMPGPSRQTEPERHLESRDKGKGPASSPVSSISENQRQAAIFQEAQVPAELSSSVLLSPSSMTRSLSRTRRGSATDTSSTMFDRHVNFVRRNRPSFARSSNPHLASLNFETPSMATETSNIRRSSSFQEERVRSLSEIAGGAPVDQRNPLPFEIEMDRVPRTQRDGSSEDSSSLHLPVQSNAEEEAGEKDNQNISSHSRGGTKAAKILGLNNIYEPPPFDQM